MRRLDRPWMMEVTVEGLNMERFIRLAGEQGISMSDMKRRSPKCISALVRENDVPGLQILANAGGWRLRTGNRQGAGKAADWLHRRWLAMILILFAAISMGAASQVMWQVEIIDAGVYAAEIRQTLNEQGIIPPRVKALIDIGEIREKLEWQYPRIAWFECGWRGSTLVIRTVEGVLPKKEGEDAVCDIVAERDAIVKRIVTSAGTAMVSPGDFVREGDILIRGEERTNDGAMKPVCADGLVTGRVWEGASVQMPCTEIVTTYTGSRQTVWTIHTPWFDLWQLPECEYKCYDVSVSEQAICGIFLPMKLITETRLEATRTTVLRDTEQVRKEAEEAALRKLYEKIADQESLIDIWGNCSMIDAENVLSLAVGEMLVEIGKQRPRSEMAAPEL